MAEITDAFIAAFPDGYPVAKPEARAIGPLIDAVAAGLDAAIVDLATALLADGIAVVVASVGALPAGVTVAIGFVRTGADAGIYTRDTAGVWTDTGLTLPGAIAAQVAAHSGEIADLSDRVTAAEGTVAAYGVALDAEVAARGALDTRVTATEAGIGALGGSAGPERSETWRAWTTVLTGEPEEKPPLDPALLQVTADGRVLMATGPGIWAPREIVRAEPGHIYLIEGYVRRWGDAPDPAGAAVDVCVMPLTSTKAPLASTPIRVRVTDLTVASGRRKLSLLVSGDALGGDVVQWPAGTAYIARSVQTYDVGHTTGIEAITCTDVTALWTAGMRLDDLTAALAALAARVTTAEGDIGALEAGLTDEVAARADVAARLAAEIAEREALIRTAGGPVLYLATPTGEVVGVLSSAGRLELLPGGEYATSDGLSLTAARLALLGAVLSGDGLDIDGLRFHRTDASGFMLADVDGGVWFRARPDGIDLPGFSASWMGGPGLTIADERLGWMGRLLPDRTQLPFGELVARDDIPGLVVVDMQGGVHFWTGQTAEIPEPEPVVPDVTPLLSPVLAGWADDPPVVHVPQMFADRGTEALATLQLAGTHRTATGTQTLEVPLPAAGAVGSGVLTVRPRGRAVTSLRRLPVDIVSVPPAPSGSPAVSVLVNGDSIAYGQGVAILAATLGEKGIATTCVGTMTSGGLPSGSGPLGETRSGMEAREIAYTKADRLIPVPTGEEAAYLAASAPDQRFFNPFIRPATGSDPSGDVRNGHILDFPVYSARFSVPAPDIFLHQYGTNDVRDTVPATPEEIYEADTLIYRRLRLGWPSTRILRMLPAPARWDGEGPELWTVRYAGMLRAMMAAIHDSNDLFAGSPIILCPGWAFQPVEAGFAVTVTETDSVTGVQTAVMEDGVHPLDTSRRALWRSAAAYTAAMTLGLI